MPASGEQRRFVLFGGQGSPTVFSDSTAATAEEDANSSSACSILLSKCHAAFLEDIASLDDRSQNLLAIDSSRFSCPSHLLKPPALYHTHAVIQATTLYLCQVLHYLAETLRQYPNQGFQEVFDGLQETAGFSSGLLPATVVARSRTVDDFLANGVRGFRFAFWTAYHSRAWSREAEARANDVAPGHDPSSETTCSLVIRGLTPGQVEERLCRYAATKNEQNGSIPTQSRQLRISAISSQTVVSVSGPRGELSNFRADTVTDVITAFAHIHGWYHGGDRLEAAVPRVLEDLQDRAATFPPCPHHCKLMRSTQDGALYVASDTESLEPSEWLVRHLLVHCVDWSRTASKITESVKALLELDTVTSVKVLSFGPGSGTLLAGFQAGNSRIKVLDLSPFRAGNRASLPNSHDDDIAIVGMSVNLPRGKGTEELWKTLSDGLSAVQTIPESRFKVSDYYSTEEDAKSRSMPVKHGAFLPDPFCFDNAFFNISPREAKSMDPQQRLLLHAAQEALEDAGYVADSTPSFQRACTGCYIGVATGDYADNLRDNIDVFYAPSTLRAFNGGRISYFYKFSGPTIVSDTACSSSMVSVYQACRALQQGDCTAAIAGGVNVISSPDIYLGLAKGHFLSPTGGCKSFDADADGYCRAEGCVLFVLKRLSAAVAENDRIHGVIRNVMVNQSGNARSITHPHSQTQIDLFHRLMKQVNIEPGSVGFVEAHGTGTQVGDACEMESLKAVFGPHHSLANPLVVGSIKSNIGHSEAASGAAGLAKLLLMLRHHKIPVQAGLRNINPRFADMASAGLVTPSETVAWSHAHKTPRRALLNNFGASGSNASLLLEEWVAEPAKGRNINKLPERSAYVFALSTKSPKALQRAIEQHIQYLRDPTSSTTSVEDICYTAVARRQIHEYRISVTCTSVSDLRAKLESLGTLGTMRAIVPARHISKSVFVFSGQGSLYEGMGRELMSTLPRFKNVIVKCDTVLQGLGYPSILSFFSGPSGHAGEILPETDHVISSQCACVALEYALAVVFVSWGIVPQYVMGHSLGEYAALCFSGVLTLEDTLHVVAARATMMTQQCAPNSTGMMACSLSSDRTNELISTCIGDAPELTVACINGINDCVVGGPLGQLEIFQTHCQAMKLRTKVLETPFAFHTSAMDPILEPLKALGSSIKFSRPTTPIISTVFGRLLGEDDLSSDYFAAHARQPVLFTQSLASMKASKAVDDALFLELGPHPTLLPMVETFFGTDISHAYLGTLRKGQSAWVSLSRMLSEIYVLDSPVIWRQIFSPTSAKLVSLPGYPLDGSTYFTPRREDRGPQASVALDEDTSSTRRHTKTGLTLLPWMKSMDQSKEACLLETSLGVIGPLILGHDVGGTPICPASVFHELALEGASMLLEPPDGYLMVVSGLNMTSPLVYKQSREVDVVTVDITKHSLGSGADFKISSCFYADLTEEIHCTGTIILTDSRTVEFRWSRDAAMVTRQSRYLNGSGKDDSSIFRTKVLYQAVFPRVVRYSPEYQSLLHLAVADGNLEGIGLLRLPFGTQTRGYLVPPVFTDTLLHAAGFIANLGLRSDEVGICARVESIEISHREIDYLDTFTVYCSLLEVKGAILADTVALDSAGKVVAVVRGMEFKRLRLHAFQHLLSQRLSASDSWEFPRKVSAETSGSETINTPPTEASDISSSISHDTVRASLKSLVKELGGFNERDLDYEKPLEQLGIDSLMLIEIIAKLAHAFPCLVGSSRMALSECATLASLEHTLLESIMGVSEVRPLHQPTLTHTTAPSKPQKDPGWGNALRIPLMQGQRPSANGGMQAHNNLVALHLSPADMSMPLCLIHDGSGQVSMYARLHGHDRSTYAIFDPHFGSDNISFQSLSHMAEEYTSHLAQSRPNTPIIVGGWSFGGIAAFEMVRQLMAKGFDVKGLVLVDSPSPIDHQPLPDDVISYAISLSDQKVVSVFKSHDAIRNEFQSNASLLGNYEAVPLPRQTGRRSLPTVMLRSQRVLDTESLCGVRYDWLSKQSARDASIADWEGLIGGHIEVLPIPGNHFEVFSPENIGKTSAQLWKACRYIEKAMN